MSRRPSPAALLRYAKSETHPTFSQQTSPVVARVVAGIVATGLKSVQVWYTKDGTRPCTPLLQDLH